MKVQSKGLATAFGVSVALQHFSNSWLGSFLFIKSIRSLKGKLAAARSEQNKF
jgi:hypothetical protein